MAGVPIWMGKGWEEATGRVTSVAAKRGVCVGGGGGGGKASNTDRIPRTVLKKGVVKYTL